MPREPWTVKQAAVGRPFYDSGEEIGELWAFLGSVRPFERWRDSFVSRMPTKLSTGRT